LVWLIFPTAYSFLMISPNLHDIWVVFFLNLSQELKLVLLLCLGPRAMATHCRAVKNSLRGTIPFLGIAWPQPQFPHSCVFEKFIYSQDQSTYFLQQNRQTHRGNI
jgi:hypothetical protein